MNEEELKTYIQVVIEYFKNVTGDPVEMGVPYIKDVNSSIILDYTGLIGISGVKKGGIYITASKLMLTELTSSLLGIETPDEETLCDMAGEIANTVSGNVRESFGSSFMISVPIVLKGAPRDIVVKIKPPVFVIPIKWRTHQLYLVVGLE